MNISFQAYSFVNYLLMWNTFLFCRTCAGCHREIGHGRFLSCMGSVWHPECFCCHACSQPIYDYEVRSELTFLSNFYKIWPHDTMMQFSMSGNHPYHKTCYKECFHPKCDVCKQFVRTALLLCYYLFPFECSFCATFIHAASKKWKYTKSAFEFLKSEDCLHSTLLSCLILWILDYVHFFMFLLSRLSD
jgi:hypothetical protein